jgi:manganese/zinc/iron transport system permease protein
VLVAFAIFVVSLLVAPGARHARGLGAGAALSPAGASAAGAPRAGAGAAGLRGLDAAAAGGARGSPGPTAWRPRRGARRRRRRCATSAGGRSLRGLPAYEAAAALYDGLRDIETVLTPDQIADIDARIGGMREVRP